MRVHTRFARTCNIFRVRSYRAHALSSVAKSLLSQLDMRIPNLSDQVAAASRSALRVAQLDAVDLPAVCKLVSSVKMEHWLRVD